MSASYGHPLRLFEYRFLRKTLGEGSFGKVELAVHVPTSQYVAIKIMENVTCARAEVQALRDLEHPNIIQMKKVVECESKCYVVMDYCRGGDLNDYIRAKGKLEVRESRGIFRQLGHAVAYIHNAGYIHRDIKPENILLDDRQKCVKLTDLSFAAKPKLGFTEVENVFVGTPHFMAPEIIRHSGYCSGKVDVWSMGVTLYAMLCGHLPFDDSNHHTLYRKITEGKYFCPSWLSSQSRSIISQMLHINKYFRITVDEVIAHPWMCE